MFVLVARCLKKFVKSDRSASASEPTRLIALHREPDMLWAIKYRPRWAFEIDRRVNRTAFCRNEQRHEGNPRRCTSQGQARHGNARTVELTSLHLRPLANTLSPVSMPLAFISSSDNSRVSLGSVASAAGKSPKALPV